QREVFARYRHFFHEFVNASAPVRMWKTLTFVFWGAPGTGKSSFARFLHSHSQDPSRLYEPSAPPRADSSNIPWFADYQGHRHVLFDEYKGQYAENLFKRLTGDGAYTVRTSSSTPDRHWLAKVLYICSNTDPQSWYGVDLDIDRRIDG